MAGTAIAGVAATIPGVVAQAGENQKKGNSMAAKKKLYPGGALSTEQAKQAYFDMMKGFDYPIPDILKTDDFWVCDFDQGDVL